MDYVDNLDKIDIYILIGAFLCPLFIMFTKIKNRKSKNRKSKSVGNIKQWPRVGGKIKTSGIKDQKFRNAARRWGAWKDLKGYTPYVVYEYKYCGKKYTGIDITPIKTISTDLSETEEVLKKYPEGQLVDIYANPNWPSEAYLEPVNVEMYMKLTEIMFSALFPLLAVVIVFLKHQ